jgi:hypothetical protein
MQAVRLVFHLPGGARTTAWRYAHREMGPMAGGRCRALEGMLLTVALPMIPGMVSGYGRPL